MASIYQMKVYRTDTTPGMACVYGNTTQQLLDDAGRLPPDRQFVIELRFNGRALYMGETSAEGKLKYYPVTSPAT